MKKRPNRNLMERYRDLDKIYQGNIENEQAIRPDLLLTFPYDYPDSRAEVAIDTEEFTAVCPWTGLPDFGNLAIRYVPHKLCLELKSLKYYLMSFRSVGIVQEHAANRILNDLVKVCHPKKMHLSLDYHARGGLHTVVQVVFPKPR